MTNFELKNGIFGYGSPILGKKVQKVEDFDANLANLIENMYLKMRDAGGVGLSANQVGQDAAVFVYEWVDYKGEFVNPEIRILSDSVTIRKEGCLSAPGLGLEVARADSVMVSGADRGGARVTLKADGFLARILQHEMDHLNGICIADSMPRDMRRKYTRELLR